MRILDPLIIAVALGLSAATEFTAGHVLAYQRGQEIWGTIPRKS